MTSTGAVSPDDLGVTLIHEHVLIDVRCYWDPESEAVERAPDLEITPDILGRIRLDPVGVTRQNLILDSVSDAVDELSDFKRAGGGTIVDLTPRGTAPRIGDVARAAAAAGVRVIFGSGFYVEGTLPNWVVEASEAEVSQRILEDFRQGVDGTDFKAGIIGEIGTSDPVSPTERKVLRAAAVAQRETGAALNVHLEEWGRNGHEVLDVIDERGGDLSRVVLSHLDSKLDLGYHMTLAARGSYIEYDLFGTEEYRLREGRFNPTDRERVAAIHHLMSRGLGEQLLISSDVCTKTQLRRYGGHGYPHVITNVVEMLRHSGVEQSTIDLLLRKNPARVLSLP